MWNLDINGTNNQLFDHIVLEQLDQPQRSRKVCMDYGTIMVLKCTAALYFFYTLQQCLVFTMELWPLLICQNACESSVMQMPFSSAAVAQKFFREETVYY